MWNLDVTLVFTSTRDVWNNCAKCEQARFTGYLKLVTAPRQFLRSFRNLARNWRETSHWKNILEVLPASKRNAGYFQEKCTARLTTEQRFIKVKSFVAAVMDSRQALFPDLSSRKTLLPTKNTRISRHDASVNHRNEYLSSRPYIFAENTVVPVSDLLLSDIRARCPLSREALGSL